MRSTTRVDLSIACSTRRGAAFALLPTFSFETGFVERHISLSLSASLSLSLSAPLSLCFYLSISFPVFQSPLSLPYVTIVLVQMDIMGCHST